MTCAHGARTEAEVDGIAKLPEQSPKLPPNEWWIEYSDQIIAGFVKRVLGFEGEVCMVQVKHTDHAHQTYPHVKRPLAPQNVSGR